MLMEQQNLQKSKCESPVFLRKLKNFEQATQKIAKND
jgi:hypothetical protein